MASEVQNSNPTILNAADLPSRLRPTAPTKPGIHATGIFSSARPSVANQEDPFSSSPDLSEPSDSEDELMEEPIDEQEIYGKLNNHLTYLQILFVNMKRFQILYLLFLTRNILSHSVL